MFFWKSATIEPVKISAVIIAFNEEQKIARAIESVAWADEILVVDSGSTDRTRDIAAELGARVVVEEWRGFGRQKQFAAESAAHDWIFSLDADEVVSDELRDEVLALRDNADLADGYRIPRLSFYLGTAVKNSGWYPDWQLRFYDRRKGRWKEVLVHESVTVEGRVSRLRHDLLHFSVDDVAHHHRMIGERYAPLAAAQMFQNGRRTSFLKIAIASPAAFFQSYVMRLGFLDGLAGLAIARFAAHHAFLKHLLLWELCNPKN